MNRKILVGDCLETLRGLPDCSVHTCVTSPPYYGLRSYLTADHPDKPLEIGSESTLAAYICRLVAVFEEVRRVLRDDGTLWLNIGDSYANDGKWGGSTGGKHVKGLHGETGVGRDKRQTGFAPKNLMMVPARLAIALQDAGWYLRAEIVWDKPNCMPESVTDRPTRSHEMVYMFSKCPRYYFDGDAIKETAVNGDPHSPRSSRGVGENVNSGLRKQDALGKRTYTDFNDRLEAKEPLTMRNCRSVWHINTQGLAAAHFAVMPESLVLRCLLAGCPTGGIVLDPFGGAGTVGVVAKRTGRDYILCELNADYATMAQDRIRDTRDCLPEIEEPTVVTPQACQGDLFTTEEDAL